MSEARIRIVTTDLETQDKGMREIPPGDYCLVVTEPMYLDGVVQHSNGTVILTLKRRKETA